MQRQFIYLFVWVANHLSTLKKKNLSIHYGISFVFV